MMSCGAAKYGGDLLLLFLDLAGMCTLTHSHLLTSISIAHFYLLCDLFAKVIVTRTPQIAAMLFLPAVQCHNNNNNNETKKTGHPVTCVSVSVCECVPFCILCIALTFCGLRKCPWPQLSLYPSPALCLSPSSCTFLSLSLSLDKFKLRN